MQQPLGGDFETIHSFRLAIAYNDLHGPLAIRIRIHLQVSAVTCHHLIEEASFYIWGNNYSFLLTSFIPSPLEFWVTLTHAERQTNIKEETSIELRRTQSIIAWLVCFARRTEGTYSCWSVCSRLLVYISIFLFTTLLCRQISLTSPAILPPFFRHPSSRTGIQLVCPRSPPQSSFSVESLVSAAVVNKELQALAISLYPQC